MIPDIVQATSEARLSLLVSRIAVIVADIAGKERALEFIESCRVEDEAHGLRLLDVGTGLR